MEQNFRDRVRRALAKDVHALRDVELVLDPVAPTASEPDLPLAEIERDGDLEVHCRRFPSHFRHGGWSMGEIRRRETTGLDLLGRDFGLTRFAWEHAAFLDTETTSLSSGSGVLVFLTGIAIFEDDELVLRQFLMSTPDAEELCLARIAQALEARDHLVTFFGKAFDQHRLLDRARVMDVNLPLPRDHYDLYWLSRRFVGRRFRDLKLRTLEHELLRFDRHNDLPGSEAPEAYFRYLRGEGDERLRAILQHNLFDVLSLTSLAAELCLRMERPEHPDERRARAWARMKCAGTDESFSELQECLRNGAPARDWLQFSALCRRRSDVDREIEALEQALSLAPDSVEVLLSLAKCFEHRRKDPSKATDYAEQALLRCRTIERPEIEARLRRLRSPKRT